MAGYKGIQLTPDAIENFKKMGVTPKDVMGWIDEGRERGISDDGIKQYIKAQYQYRGKQYNKAIDDKYGATERDNLNFAIQNVLPVADRIGALRENLTTGKPYSQALDERQKGIQKAKNTLELIAEHPEYSKASDFLSERTVRNLAKYLPMGAKIARDTAVMAAVPATLTAKGAFAYNALTGFGEGSGLEQRLANAVLGGVIGGTTAGLMNKIFPSSASTAAVTNAMKTQTKNMLRNVYAGAKEAGVSVPKYIAEHFTPQQRKELFNVIARNAVEENAFRPIVQGQAEKIAQQGQFHNYIGKALDKYAKGLGAEYKSAVREATKKLSRGNRFVSLDERAVADEALNKIIPESATDFVKSNILEPIYAQRAVASDLLQPLLSRLNTSGSGSAFSMARRAYDATIRKLANKGALRSISGAKVPNAVRYGSQLLGKEVAEEPFEQFGAINK